MKMIKKMIDFTVSILGILFLSPLLILVSILIKIETPGNILFYQERIGKNGKKFKVFKFRSMVENAVNLGAGLYMEGENDPRITKIGKFIRKTSIDELPQLFNILKGEMSIVGPRPLLEETTNQMSIIQKKRLSVKPGITGWAQVNGRNELSMKERIEKDLWYIENQSLILDFKIILKTIKVIFYREGIRMDQKKSDVEKF